LPGAIRLALNPNQANRSVKTDQPSQRFHTARVTGFKYMSATRRIAPSIRGYQPYIFSGWHFPWNIALGCLQFQKGAIRLPDGQPPYKSEHGYAFCMVCIDRANIYVGQCRDCARPPGFTARLLSFSKRNCDFRFEKGYSRAAGCVAGIRFPGHTLPKQNLFPCTFFASFVNEALR